MIQAKTYFASDLVALGSVRRDAHDSGWREVCWTANQEGLGFPRRSFAVTPGVRGAQPAVLHPGVVTLPQPFVEYTRARIDPEGEDTDWIWLRPDLREELAPAPSASSGALDQGWRRSVSPSQLLRQRRLHRIAEAWNASDARADPAVLEAEVLDLVRSLGLTTQVGMDEASVRRGLARRAAIQRVVEALAAEPDTRRGTAELAAIAGLTPSHFCVAFRRETGLTVSAYLTELRLCTALDRLTERGADLSALAFDLGFSSHSHFAARFRRHFGCSPSEARRRLATI